MSAPGSTCMARWLDRPDPCGAPAEGRYRRTCERGHSREGFLCAGHAAPPATAYCRPCHDEGLIVPLDLERIGDVLQDGAP